MPKPRRVALVTGGARRVGRAIVRRLAEAGYDIAFTYLTSDREAIRLLKWLKSKKRTGIAIRADLTSLPAAIEHVHQQFLDQFDRLDVLVNNASIYAPGDLRETGVPLMRSLAAIHVQSPLLLCQKFEPMLRRSRGHVINMVDLLAEKPWPKYLAYCASKAALWNLTLGLARELAPQVTVNGIAPGAVEWPPDYPRAEREKYLQRVPLGRAGSPEDVAALVHFLCTEGGYITGQIIRIDGGRSIT